jgi:hypothetical protein
LPIARLVVFVGRRNVHTMVKPAVPTRRNFRSFRDVLVYHPTTCTALRVGPTLIVDIAQLVLAHARSVAPSVKTCSKGLAIPPGKELKDEFFHQTIPYKALQTSQRVMTLQECQSKCDRSIFRPASRIYRCQVKASYEIPRGFGQIPGVRKNDEHARASCWMTG